MAKKTKTPKKKITTRKNNTQKAKKNIRIAIVADWLTNRGGAEHVIEALAKAFPKANIYTSVFVEKHFPTIKPRVKESILGCLPQKLKKKHQFLLPLLPFAFQQLKLSQYDVIISSSSAFSKCLTLNPQQKHICYCHTPTRYLYHAKQEYKTQYKVPFWVKPLKFLFWRPLMAYLTNQDQKGAKTVTHFLANSEYVANRIKKYYKKIAQVLYPCVNIQPFLAYNPNAPHTITKNLPKNYFLAIGRFIPYKKFDLLVKTFVKNGLPLVLGGIGPELEKCKQIAIQNKAKNIHFLGFAERNDLPELYANATAFLFPAIEDFGLTPVEAMASGTPIIFKNEGGAIESVTPTCGIPFEKQTEASLQKAINKIKQNNTFKPETLQNRAKIFDERVFIQKIQEIVEQVRKEK